MNFLNSIAYAVRYKPDAELREKIDFVIGTHFDGLSVDWDKSTEYCLHFRYSGEGELKIRDELTVEANYREPTVSLEAGLDIKYKIKEKAPQIPFVVFPGLPDPYPPIAEICAEIRAALECD